MESIKDESGESILLRRLPKNRFVSEAFPPEHIFGIADVKLRDDDVLICAYPKSGTHWLWENLRMLISGRVFIDTVDKDSSMMEFFKPGQLDNRPSPRVLNNHGFFDDQPKDLVKGNKKAKVILLYRNPKDIAVSYYYHVKRFPVHQYNGEFKNFIRRLATGIVPFSSPFDYWKIWESGLRENPHIEYLPVRYEDLHKDTVGELTRIMEFLGHSKVDQQLLEAVVKATSFDSMKETKQKECLRGNDGKPIMYRKGKVGDWQNHFTDEDSAWFDDVIKRELGDSKLFEFIYSLE